MREFKIRVEKLVEELGLNDVLMSREFKSFIRDPIEHLKKKIIFYMHDLLRSRVSLIGFFIEAPRPVS